MVFSSGSLGIEMAKELRNNDAIDLNFNWYGQLFNSPDVISTFSHGPSNFDFQLGYSHELWDGGPDLRLNSTGYKFQTNSDIYGYYGGAELKSRDGMFALKYYVGNDKINKTYQIIGGFINIGFRLDKLISGENPVSMPEPIFKSPRNLRRMITEKVKRDWEQSYVPGMAAITSASLSGGLCRTVEDASWYVSTQPAPFTSVPWSQLDPNLFVHVTLTYINTYSTTHLPVKVSVGSYYSGSVQSPDFSASDQEPHTVTLQLCGSQRIFKDNNLSPFSFWVSGSGYVSLLNVTICFNQPDDGSCP